ncbi:TPA_asm: protein N [Allium angulosum virus 1]|uniref:protein N n=1 Tax=Allium angulosum virus 1 TaxID=2851934 RepID=UPI00205BF88B|nr:protein N [Allium angulosum virus 1]DAZ85332.1 TPA_asm: protein N [Allium angulosum virus 1]
MSLLETPAELYDDNGSRDEEMSESGNPALLSSGDLDAQSQDNENEETHATRARRMLVPDLDVQKLWGERYTFPTVPSLTDKLGGRDLVRRGIPSETDWPDSRMHGKTGIRLIYLSTANRLRIGKRVINDLHTGISDKTIGGIFLSAWNLCSDMRGTRVYPMIDPTRNEGDIRYKDLDTFPEPQRQFNIGVDYVGSEIMIAEGLSFFCGSLLRLFTKSAENYLRAWETIKRTFLSFYGTSFPIRNLMPQKEMIENLKAKLNALETYRNTLTGFLSTPHDPDSNSSGIRNFLYEIHLAFAGMHSFTLCIHITDRMKIAPIQLLSAAYHTTTKDAIDEISDILVRYDRAEHMDRYRLGTWRFARIFSSRYFAKVHSRKCPELITIFSAIVDKLESQENRNNDIFSIAHTQILSPETFAKYKEIGVRLYVHFMGEPGEIVNPVFDRVMGGGRDRDDESEEEGSQEGSDFDDVNERIRSDVEENDD